MPVFEYIKEEIFCQLGKLTFIAQLGAHFSVLYFTWHRKHCSIQETLKDRTSCILYSSNFAYLCKVSCFYSLWMSFQYFWDYNRLHLLWFVIDENCICLILGLWFTNNFGQLVWGVYWTTYSIQGCLFQVNTIFFAFELFLNNTILTYLFI